MKARHRRGAIVLAGLAASSVAVALVLRALDNGIALFITPTQVATGHAPQGRMFRLGGLVKVGSLHREGLSTRFIVSDTQREIPVTFTGILPDLFREGRGVVAQGRIGGDGAFEASEVLAKHDENYMPPEARSALEQARQHSAGSGS